MKAKSSQLIFLPHAGGSCLSYSKPFKELSQDIEVQILDLPGRNQFHEHPWPITWEELIPLLYRRIAPIQKNMIIMGHSFGSLVALELAAYCIHQGHRPVLGISGMNAPVSQRWKEQKEISRLPEIEFKEHLKTYGEIPDSVPAQFINLIKADFSMMESYVTPQKRDIPTLVFGGTEDPVTSVQGLEAWNDLIDLKHPPFLYKGNHFQFFNNHIGLIISELIHLR